MAGISDKDKAVMEAKASGPVSFSSLAETLQSQLDQAQQSQKSFQEFQPTAQKSAEAIGGFEGRAPGESPVDVRAQGLTTAQAISQTAGRTQGNILDVITSMMNLKKQQSADEQRVFDNQIKQQEFEQSLSERGLKLDENNEVVGMTDAEKADSQIYMSDPVVWLNSQPGGPQILASVTSVAAQEAIASAVKNSGGVEQYLTSVNRDALFTKKQKETMDAARDLSQVANDFLRNYEGENIPGVGTFQGRAPELFLSKEGKEARQKLFTVVNDKIRQISGAAVSGQEAERLAKQLSDAKTSDEGIRIALQSVVNSVAIGEEMKKKAILDNISLDDAYKKYGAEAYRESGQEVPEWLAKEEQKSELKSAEDYWNELE